MLLRNPRSTVEAATIQIQDKEEEEASEIVYHNRRTTFFALQSRLKKEGAILDGRILNTLG